MLSGCGCVQQYTQICHCIQIGGNIIFGVSSLHIVLCGEQTSYSVFGWRGLNACKACQLSRSIRDMREGD